MIVRKILTAVRIIFIQFLKFVFIDLTATATVKNFVIRKIFLKKIANNVIIYPGVRWAYGDNIKLDKHVVISLSCYLDDLACITIAYGTVIGPSCRLITGTHDVGTMETRSKPIVIGKFCWLGANVTVLPGVKIGDYSIIGAGSVVVKDIPEYSIAVGNPARVIKRREVKVPYKLWCGEYVNDFNNLP